MPDRPDFESEPNLLAGVPGGDESLGSFLNRMQAVADEQSQPQFEEVEEQAETPEETFAPEMAKDVVGLVHIGHLTGRFDVLGHSFVLRTLKLGEELVVGQMVDEFAGTVVQAQAFAAALVAASIETVDGKPLLPPLGPDISVAIRDKFEYITTKWATDTVLEVYAAYKTLQERQVKAYDAVAGKSRASRGTYIA